MTELENERESLQEVRERLDGWLYDARWRAFDERFDGPDASNSVNGLPLLDRIDSRLRRAWGHGLWDADEYGIIQSGTLDAESTPCVVCRTHPQDPEDPYSGAETLDDATRANLTPHFGSRHLGSPCQSVPPRMLPLAKMVSRCPLRPSRHTRLCPVLTRLCPRCPKEMVTLPWFERREPPQFRSCGSIVTIS